MLKPDCNFVLLDPPYSSNENSLNADLVGWRITSSINIWQLLYPILTEFQIINLDLAAIWDVNNEMRYPYSSKGFQQISALKKFPETTWWLYLEWVNC